MEIISFFLLQVKSYLENLFYSFSYLRIHIIILSYFTTVSFRKNILKNYLISSGIVCIIMVGKHCVREACREYNWNNFFRKFSFSHMEEI